MSYAQLLSSLQQLQLVQLRTLAPPVGRLSVGYDANTRCSFHSGAPGHDIENCKAFKHVVQDLIDSKAIDLAPAPNVVNNPMPQHGGANVNLVEGEAKSIKDVLKLKTPLEAAEKWKVEKGQRGKGQRLEKRKLEAQRFAGLISFLRNWNRRSGSPPTAENAENSAFCLVLAQEQLLSCVNRLTQGVNRLTLLCILNNCCFVCVNRLTQGVNRLTLL
ncbi:hypothetical protein KIW84_057878 [Lathyrus oleraceus]|uniref:Gag-pol polyprotein n=1 Tax=Pisum sativum TaxID=3888 RepID=A0A9D5AIP9_PEA|nr:hypothetical protein KIW84_057878 [Pisum sativum]